MTGTPGNDTPLRKTHPMPLATDQMLTGGSVPIPCQNGRQTAVISGHPRAPRTASTLGSPRLTPCLKRPSKQAVTVDAMDYKDSRQDDTNLD